MPSIYDDYPSTSSKSKSKSTSEADMSRCTPMLDRLSGFGPGTGMARDRLVMAFVRYMNQRPLAAVQDFLQTKRSCKESHKKGFVVKCDAAAGTAKSCCDTPWAKCGDR